MAAVKKAVPAKKAAKPEAPVFQQVFKTVEGQLAKVELHTSQICW